MLTNKINVTYNMENIDADFDIFIVEKNNKDYYKYNILDSAIYEFKAAAVQWAFGAKALVLFRKGEVTEREFKESLMKEYQDVTVRKINIFDAEQCKTNFYHENRLLAQLLFNSIRTPKHDSFMYNNLTGKLLYHEPSWKSVNKTTNKISFIRFLEIVIDPDMYLNLEHKTFKKYDREAKELYVFDAKTGEFRKKLKTDINVDTYIEGSLPHNHFKVDNLNITNIKKFKKCKLGIMQQFLFDVKEKLNPYLTVELVEREDIHEVQISRLEKKGITEEDYGIMLRKKGVVIIDENKTEISTSIVEKLKDELERHCHVEAIVGNLSKDKYNIRIIHNDDYYDENDLTDPHSIDLKGYIVQHMTEEAQHFNDSKGLSPAIKKIVQELIIKGDVRDNKISIFDWNRLDSDKEWTFIIRKKSSKEKIEHLNHSGKKAYSYYIYYRLLIDRDGNLLFDSFDEQNQHESEDWNKICFAYDSISDNVFGIKNRVEGLVYSNIDNIHAILLTREQTIPNISELYKTLEETDIKRIKKDILLQALDHFESENQKYKQDIGRWKCEILDEEESISKTRIKKILNLKTTSAAMFIRFLHEYYDIWIDGELRKKEFESTFQIGNLMNIKYEYIKYTDEYHKYTEEIVYYVGDKSKKRNYPNACCMRKVISLGDKLDYEELFPLMTVEFVRNSQYTVLPFPFKYLREYMEKHSQ